MKLAIIVIRPDMYYVTSEALMENSFYSLSTMEVTGRGKKSVPFTTMTGGPAADQESNEMLAKKIIEIYVRDDQVDELIKVVVGINQTHRSGDGKIFILPVGNGLRIRTGETGNESLM